MFRQARRGRLGGGPHDEAHCTRVAKTCCGSIGNDAHEILLCACKPADYQGADPPGEGPVGPRLPDDGRGIMMYMLFSTSVFHEHTCLHPHGRLFYLGVEGGRQDHRTEPHGLYIP